MTVQNEVAATISRVYDERRLEYLAARQVSGLEAMEECEWQFRHMIRQGRRFYEGLSRRQGSLDNERPMWRGDCCAGSEECCWSMMLQEIRHGVGDLIWFEDDPFLFPTSGRGSECQRKAVCNALQDCSTNQ